MVTASSAVSVGPVAVGPQQLAPAAAACFLAAGSQQAPACPAAFAVPQHTLVVSGWVDVADPQQLPLSAAVGWAGLVRSVMTVCTPTGNDGNGMDGSAKVRQPGQHLDPVAVRVGPAPQVHAPAATLTDAGPYRA